MHAMRREHTPKSNSLEWLPLQVLEADINLASLGGPMVRLRLKLGGVRSDDTEAERTKKTLNRGGLIVA